MEVKTTYKANSSKETTGPLKKKKGISSSDYSPA